MNGAEASREYPSSVAGPHNVTARTCSTAASKKSSFAKPPLAPQCRPVAVLPCERPVLVNFGPKAPVAHRKCRRSQPKPRRQGSTRPPPRPLPCPARSRFATPPNRRSWWSFGIVPVTTKSSCSCVGRSATGKTGARSQRCWCCMPPRSKSRERTAARQPSSAFRLTSCGSSASKTERPPPPRSPALSS